MRALDTRPPLTGGDEDHHGQEASARRAQARMDDQQQKRSAPAMLTEIPAQPHRSLPSQQRQQGNRFIQKRPSLGWIKCPPALRAIPAAEVRQVVAALDAVHVFPSTRTIEHLSAGYAAG